MLAIVNAVRLGRRPASRRPNSSGKGSRAEKGVDVESELVGFGIEYIVGGDIGRAQTLVVSRIREGAVAIRDLPGPDPRSEPLQRKASGGSS